jgi:hypothetical protein
LLLLVAAGPVVTVEKPELFAEVFPSSGGNHEERDAAGDHFRFPLLRQFPQAFAFAAVKMCLGNHK